MQTGNLWEVMKLLARASVTMELASPWVCGRTSVGYNHALVDTRLLLNIQLPRRIRSLPLTALQTAPLCCRSFYSRKGVISRAVCEAASGVEVCTEPARTQLQTKIEGLNDEQILAVTSDAGCVRVSAGPGSGKTRVLTHRIAHLVRDRGVCASQILAITFTNKAAVEITERLRILMPAGGDKKPTTGTFHSVCAKILRRNVGLLELGVTSNFVIYDEKDSEKLLKSICEEVLATLDQEKSSPQDNRPPHSVSIDDVKKEPNKRDGDRGMAMDLLRWIGAGQQTKRDRGPSSKNLKDILKKVLAIKGRKLEQFISNQRKGFQGPQKGIPDEYLFTRIAIRYEAGLKNNNAIDFDDLLGWTVRLLHLHPSVLEDCRKQWTHVLVDEFQDTNQVQFEFVRLMCTTSRNLFVVGDVDQSIYGWRGADFRNMETFLTSHFPEVITYQLSKNYRSSANIVSLASFVIKHGRMTVPKTSKEFKLNHARVLEAMQPSGCPVTICSADDDRDEAQFTVREILKYVKDDKHSWGGCAIMYRARSQKDSVEEALIQASIPYKVTGETGFLQHKEIKDLQAYMMLVLDMNNDLALTRVINTPPRGIGVKTIESMGRWGSARGLSLSRALQAFMQELPSKEDLGITPVSRNSILKFCKLMDDLRSLSRTVKVADVIESIIIRTDYVKYLESQKEDQEKIQRRLENIQHLKMLADVPEETGDQYNLAEFLQSCTLFTRENTEKEDVVKLMTLHAAKGLEFDCVFLVGLEEGRFPIATGGERMDEERRLFYVGITRAQKQLYLITKARSFIRERHIEVPMKPSPFILEILSSPLYNGGKAGGRVVVTLDFTPSAIRSPPHTPRQGFSEDIH